MFKLDGWFGFFLIEIVFLLWMIDLIMDTKHFTVLRIMEIAGLSGAMIIHLVRAILDYKKRKNR